MQADVFHRTSGARNPIVNVKIFFLQLKVVLQAKPCKGGRCNLEGWSRLLHALQKRTKHIFACRGRYNLRQRVLPITPTPYVAHSETLYPLIA